MTHFHSHTECKHEHLKLCNICWEVYCEDCGKEWIPKSQFYIYSNSNSYYDPNTKRNPGIGITYTPTESHDHK